MRSLQCHGIWHAICRDVTVYRHPSKRKGEDHVAAVPTESESGERPQPGRAVHEGHLLDVRCEAAIT